jgi:hypothetical protein
MKTRIMYIEYKGRGLTGPARIGRATFSRSGRTLYWISGPRRDGADRLYGERAPVEVDDDVLEEYWGEIRGHTASR